MIDPLRDLPVAQLAATLCLSFVAFTWIGIFTIRPAIRWFVGKESDVNGVVGNFISMYVGGLMSFFVGAMISLIVVLDSPLRGEMGLTPEVFALLLGVMNKVLGSPAG